MADRRSSTTTRRPLAGAALAAVSAAFVRPASSAVVTIGRTELAADSDTNLLRLRADLAAAVAAVSFVEMNNDCTDEENERAGLGMIQTCWAIVRAPLPGTPAGSALKAAAAMHELRFGFFDGDWESVGQAMAWAVLSEIAGDAYTPVTVPERLRATGEPGRA